jgi:hypothetical protein
MPRRMKMTDLRGAGDPQGHRRVAAALEIERGHQLAELPRADDDVVPRDAAVLEVEVGLDAPPQPHLAPRWPDAEAGHALLDEDAADAPGPRAVVELRVHQERVDRARVLDVGLDAVQDDRVALDARAAPHVGRSRPGVRLRDGDADQHLAPRGLRQDAPALGLGPEVGHDLHGADQAVEHDLGRVGARPGQLLDDEDGLDGTTPLAAVRLGHREPEQPQLAAARDGRGGEPLLLVPRRGERPELGLGEAPDAVAQLELRRRELEIHGSSPTYRTAAPTVYTDGAGAAVKYFIIAARPVAWSGLPAFACWASSLSQRVIDSD